MTEHVTHVVVLGSTGSIGCSTLDVIGASAGQFCLVGLSGHSNIELLASQAREFSPSFLVLTDPNQSKADIAGQIPSTSEVLHGDEGIRKLVTRSEVDVVVSAIVGSAGLWGTWAALEAGKRIALANKETLVTAGPLVMRLAAESGGEILPVDSEHSAIFQALATGRREEVRRVILTASGGPFRNHTKEQLTQVTVEEALRHPTWNMGPKISIDSATMMNKALEIIEARWLFDLRCDQIDVVIHPQSVVHSMVEFVDGSVIAQLSPPDMRLPIQYALTYPHRQQGVADRLDLTKALSLQFEPPDMDRFPALRLGLQVAQRGGTAGTVLNAANEAAVESFLAGELGFNDIVPSCRTVLEHHDFEETPTLDRLLDLDCWARQEIKRWVTA